MDDSGDFEMFRYGIALKLHLDLEGVAFYVSLVVTFYDHHVHLQNDEAAWKLARPHHLKTPTDPAVSHDHLSRMNLSPLGFVIEQQVHNLTNISKNSLQIELDSLDYILVCGVFGAQYTNSPTFTPLESM